MKILEKRTELLSSIQRMSEEELDKLHQMIAEDFPHVVSGTDHSLAERPIGSMKGMLVYMADDFNAPLEDFADYMPDDQPSS